MYSTLTTINSLKRVSFPWALLLSTVHLILLICPFSSPTYCFPFYISWLVCPVDLWWLLFNLLFAVAVTSLSLLYCIYLIVTYLSAPSSTTHDLNFVSRDAHIQLYEHDSVQYKLQFIINIIFNVKIFFVLMTIKC